MKSPLDDARLRLSAAHPEMSHTERERAATRIAKSMTADELDQEWKTISDRYYETMKLMKRMDVQLLILGRARAFQTGWRASGRRIS